MKRPANLVRELINNETLRLKLEQLAAPQERLQLLEGEGYRFTQEEWEAAIEEVTSAALPDEVLGEVAGGLKVEYHGGPTNKDNPKNRLIDFIRTLFD